MNIARVLYVEEYLPSESEEVHDIVGGGGVVDVAAVDVHCVFDLTDPRLMVHRHGIHVGIGQLGHPIQHRIEFFSWKSFANVHVR